MVAWLLLLGMIHPSIGASFAPYFAIDRRVDLNELARTPLENLPARVYKRDGAYSVDVSAVLLDTDFECFVSKSFDFGSYKAMAIPTVDASVLYLRSYRMDPGWCAEPTSIAWWKTSFVPFTSKQFLEICALRGLSNGAAGVHWRLAEAQPHWILEHKPKFDSLEGSWYVAPLFEGAIYVRYFLTVRFNLPVSEMLVRREFGKQAREVIDAVRRQATYSSVHPHACFVGTGTAITKE